MMYENSFRSQFGILSGPDVLLGLSFSITFCTRSSVIVPANLPMEGVQEELTFGIPRLEKGRLHL